MQQLCMVITYIFFYYIRYVKQDTTFMLLYLKYMGLKSGPCTLLELTHPDAKLIKIFDLVLPHNGYKAIEVICDFPSRHKT